MKSKTLPFVLFGLLAVAALAAFVVWGVPYFFQTPVPEMSISTLGAGTVRAEITAILEEGMIDLGNGIEQPYQIMRVRILEGEFADIPMEIDYGKRQIRTDDIRFDPGDRVFVTVGRRPDGVITAYYVDAVRSAPMLWLLGTFVAAILLISRWKGLRSLLAMAFSLFMVIGYIIPHILAGEDPVRVSIIGSAILLGVSLYLTYGWTLKTHASVLSMLLVLVITGTLAWFFIVFTRLTGVGDENAMFLLQMQDVTINLRGILLGGMLIGALGVLDDLVTTQASAVFELHAANPDLGAGALFRSGMRIGQDHVAATVNTLVLAYAGASLPMLLLFTLGQGNYGFLVNYASVAEEIVRTLVGSLGLVAAVPLTTLIAAELARNSHRLGEWRHFLGSENSREGHHH